jgi:hypothetical protein
MFQPPMVRLLILVVCCLCFTGAQIGLRHSYIWQGQLRLKPCPLASKCGKLQVVPVILYSIVIVLPPKSFQVLACALHSRSEFHA